MASNKQHDNFGICRGDQDQIRRVRARERLRGTTAPNGSAVPMRTVERFGGTVESNDADGRVTHKNR